MTISRLRTAPAYLYTLGVTLYPPDDTLLQQHAHWKMDVLKRLSMWKYPPSKARDYGTYIFVEWVFDEGCDERCPPPPDMVSKMQALSDAVRAVWGGHEGYRRLWDDDGYTVLWCDGHRVSHMADVLAECRRIARLITQAGRAEVKRQLVFSGVAA
jgi:hypothetical protein